jgi:hypothetical protein
VVPTRREGNDDRYRSRRIILRTSGERSQRGWKKTTKKCQQQSFNLHDFLTAPSRLNRPQRRFVSSLDLSWALPAGWSVVIGMLPEKCLRIAQIDEIKAFGE